MREIRAVLLLGEGPALIEEQPDHVRRGVCMLAWLDRREGPSAGIQLAETIRVCRGSRSLSEAGRILFSASRARRASTNDADRLRKYLARFDIEWSALA